MSSRENLVQRLESRTACSAPYRRRPAQRTPANSSRFSSLNSWGSVPSESPAAASPDDTPACRRSRPRAKRRGLLLRILHHERIHGATGGAGRPGVLGPRAQRAARGAGARGASGARCGRRYCARHRHGSAGCGRRRGCGRTCRTSRCCRPCKRQCPAPGRPGRRGRPARCWRRHRGTRGRRR